MTEPDGHSGPDKKRLRMLINLLRVSRKTESHLREFLRVNHKTTLPRFDVMAALYRRPEAMTMSKLSRMLLVSNGNATDVVDRLQKEDLVKRSSSPTDKRTVFVALTLEGRKQFEMQAAAHQIEVNTWFSGMNDVDVDTMTEILKRTNTGDKA